MLLRVWSAAERIFLLLIIMLVLSLVGLGLATGLVGAIVRAGISVFGAVPDIVDAAVQMIRDRLLGGGGGGVPPTTT